MKPTKLRYNRMAFAIAVIGTVSAVQAGDLNPPPGPVGPTMKTLTQVEPRTPVNATNTPGDADSLFKITQPGSYYLTGNITGVSGKHGIEIAADNITLDLNGFALIGVAGSLDGIAVPSARVALAIRNGTIRAWGGKGVGAGSATHSLLQDLRAYNNGGIGIHIGNGGVVDRCTAGNNAGMGIRTGWGCSVSRCTAHGNSAEGIWGAFGATISGCTAFSNSGRGIYADQGGTLEQCVAYLNQGNGIEISNFGTARNCTATENTGNGIEASLNSTVMQCTASQNGGDGFRIEDYSTILNCSAWGNHDDGIEAATSRVEGNNVSGNDGAGIESSGNNFIVKNTARGNNPNYAFYSGGDRVGPITTTMSDHPWANFSFP